ncbi:hypothetical protein MNBD_GAMMA05-175 [hydrothermal vent metagenome]|uniref:Hemolysin activation/secretion protein n=1 Tax=hydrothermal vent metagenome TaxID=652676 RepID=A0A3B0W8R3_9ZZZZ
MQRLYMFMFLFFHAVVVHAVGPAVKNSGVSEKALRQSQPDYRLQKNETPTLIESEISDVPEITGPSLFINKIIVEGNSLLPEALIADIVEIGDGREMSLGELKFMVNRISHAYAKAGYVLVRAYLPQQEIVDGRVTIEVLQGKIASISASDSERYASDDIVESFNGLVGSDTLTADELQHSLLNLNDVVGISARSVLKAGVTTGATDMVVNVEEKRPYKISLDADNFGSEFTGENRYGVTALAGSMFTFGDELMFRGVTSNGEQNYINLLYRLPVIGLNTFVNASYVYSNQQLGSNLAPLKAKGDSNISTLSVSHYWKRTRSYEIAFDVGFSDRSYNNEQLGITTSDDHLANLFVGVKGFFDDSFRARTYYSVLLQAGLTGGDTSDPLNSRLNGRSDAVIGLVNLTRYQGVPVLDSYFVLKASGQWADRRVLSPDLYAAGGMGTVRGYPLAEIAGDNAVLISAEYIVPFPYKKSISLFTFIDHGATFVNEPLLGEKDKNITGAGFGVRVNIMPSNNSMPSVDLMATYATPVLGSQTPSDDSSSVFYLGGVVTY